MAVTYTNRKGVTYYLCRGLTKTGRPRHYFAREPRDEPVDEAPVGFAITESVNGVVSLVKDRPSRILPLEVAAVQRAVRQHPQARTYRVDVTHDRIDIYQRQGEGIQVLANELLSMGLRPRMTRAQMDDYDDRHAHYKPVLRFILDDAEQRIYHVQRWCYLGRIDDWIDTFKTGLIADLAPDVIPVLGTDDFYELW